MKYILTLALMLSLAAQNMAQQITLPNGWHLTPAGKSLPLGDLPLNIAVSSSKKLMAITNNGQSKQQIQLIDVKNEKIVDSVTIDKSWLGLKFSYNEKYFVCQWWKRQPDHCLQYNKQQA
jgi:hypothetical protein